MVVTQVLLTALPRAYRNVLPHTAAKPKTAHTYWFIRCASNISRSQLPDLSYLIKLTFRLRGISRFSIFGVGIMI